MTRACLFTVLSVVVFPTNRRTVFRHTIRARATYQHESLRKFGQMISELEPTFGMRQKLVSVIARRRTSLAACSRTHPVLAYRCVHGTAPAYLTDSLLLTADAPARRRLRSTDTITLKVSSTRRSRLPSATGRFRWQQLKPETVYHLRREPPQ